jgi:hypothetical protein
MRLRLRERLSWTGPNLRAVPLEVAFEPVPVTLIVAKGCHAERRADPCGHDRAPPGRSVKRAFVPDPYRT